VFTVIDNDTMTTSYPSSLDNAVINVVINAAIGIVNDAAGNSSSSTIWLTPAKWLPVT
jgi:hypothetical protein